MNFKAKLRKDLLDDRILKFISKEKVYWLQAPSPSDLWIVYQIYNEKESFYVDNSNNARVYYIQVDIYTKDDYTDLEEIIRTVLKEKGYNLGTCADLYEKETGLYHKAMRFVYTDIL
ncbi:prohead protease [Clostridium perfringens]|uniref:hypothetical protein n=1 Tax=Clostridium perfringens TaxID=1502 RepID=UPI00096A6154|nr:hypothetical protein [Clostridium perfringens]EHR9037930.1 prohead protease [Clostridium perfringens]ELC8416797.1 prohead protease [Clostridium perfringens]MDK0537612.1 prohead protease [Clostridium perfringens]MDK0829722.1 prohead protease [Clostridium perfringens]MDM0535521.1 prohead protease [Clostridium perfringens]